MSNTVVLGGGIEIAWVEDIDIAVCAIHEEAKLVASLSDVFTSTNACAIGVSWEDTVDANW